MQLRFRKMARSQSGFTLLEILLALVILGIVSAGLSVAFITSSKVLRQTDIREMAKNLAETQMEYVKKAPFETSNPSYNPDPDVDMEGYSISIEAFSVTDRDYNLQKIVITVTSAGTGYTLEDYKVNQDFF